MMTSREWAPVRYIDGYPMIEELGLIGDGAVSALVCRDGSIPWFCLPRFDSPALFCGLLDTQRGGHFTIAPEGLRDSRQRYEPGTGVLVTEMRGPDGVVELTDAITLRSGTDMAEGGYPGRRELVRRARVLSGSIRLRVSIAPRGGATMERRTGGLEFRAPHHPDSPFFLVSSRQLEGLHGIFELREGEEFVIALRWGEAAVRADHRFDAHAVIDATAAAWRKWAGHIEYEGLEERMVRRSVITLKMLDYMQNGAIVAAPTSSLPECIGGVRNWDYRYVWVRDAAFSVHAFRRIGLNREAADFLSWVIECLARSGKVQVMYNLDGHAPAEEWEDKELEGYRKSAPVRWGNAAADQTQHDAYGEIVDCAYQWAIQGGEIDPTLWGWLTRMADRVMELWKTPDNGIWEVRTDPRRFTYSNALCHVALDRVAKMARQFGLEGDIAAWTREADRIQEAILTEAWSPRINAITESLGDRAGAGTDALDASVLTLPMRRVIPFDHPRMVSTVEAVRRLLSAGDGLLYRYLPEEAPDGLPGEEGAFLLCSFWLVDNLAGQDRLDEAVALYQSLCGRANHLGLFSEEIDANTGHFKGNYPQAFSHIGVIASAISIQRAMKRAGAMK
jgi:alpha,alpha-trehalase